MRDAGTIALIAILAVSLSGCVISRDMARVQRDIERHNPELKLRRNFVLNAGSGTIHMLENLTRMIDTEDAQIAASYLHDVDRVRVGIYDVQWRDDEQPLNLAGLDRLRDGRWEHALAIREDDTVAYLLYQEGRQSIRDIFVISLAGDQLVAVRFQGDVSRIVAQALADRHRFLRGYRHTTGEQSDENR